MASLTSGEPPLRRSTAVVVAGDEETRVLLRGLLRLHHVQVVGEADGSTHGVSLLQTHRPSLLVADSTLAEGSFASLVAEAREPGRPIRIILLTSDRRKSLTAMGDARPDVILTRPFHLREFAEGLSLSEEPITNGAASTSA
jgi:DNA-binding response OmpR family regulator